MAIVQYLGYSLLACSVLPITKTSLIYGSNDGGHTVHADDERVNKLMEKIFSALNLKSHRVGMGSEIQFLSGPCDIEVHKGVDGRIYILDTARVFPPITPDRSIKGGHLYRLMRPELAFKSSTPLSSDAYSAFGRHNHQEHNTEIDAISNQLIRDIIPIFGKELDENYRQHGQVIILSTTATKNLNENFAQRELKPLKRFIIDLHLRGINIRYLGKLRNSCTEPTVKQFILLEMVSYNNTMLTNYLFFIS
jgi:hypothetical protein